MYGEGNVIGIARIYAGEKFQVQIDEPATTTHPAEMDTVVESINRSVEGIGGSVYSTNYVTVSYGNPVFLVANLIIIGGTAFILAGASHRGQDKIRSGHNR